MRNNKTYKLTLAAVFSSITALLTFTPIGMIPLPPPLLAVTLVHLPVLIATITGGITVGMITGLTFGVCSCIRAWEIGAISLTFFFRNPLISVLPRLIIPLASWLVFFLWSKNIKNTPTMKKIGISISAVVGSIVNTCASLGMLLLIYEVDLNNYINQLVSKGNESIEYLDNAAFWLISVVGIPNGIAEMVVALIIVPVVCTAIQFQKRKKK